MESKKLLKDLGYEFPTKRECSIANDSYNAALNDIIKSLEEIDACEFAMYSLCLVREKADELRGK